MDMVKKPHTAYDSFRYAFIAAMRDKKVRKRIQGLYENFYERVRRHEEITKEMYVAYYDGLESLAKEIGLDSYWRTILLEFTADPTDECLQKIIDDTADSDPGKSFHVRDGEEIIKELQGDKGVAAKKDRESFIKLNPVILFIPPYTTYTELREFIDKHYKTEIQSLQDEHKQDALTGHVRYRGSVSSRDLRIIELRDSGLPFRQVASVVNSEFNKNLSWSAARTAYHRSKKKL